MGNIYPIAQTTYEYLLARAKRHRLAGRYDKALALLAKAKGQVRDHQDIEFECASVYDEMGNEDAAVRAYQRVVRLNGTLKAQALFRLCVTFAQRADLRRAVSYFEAFLSSDRVGVSAEMAALLEHQLHEALTPVKRMNRHARAAALEKRAVACLHAGRFYAAQRCADRALALDANDQRHLLKACAHLVHGENDDAAVQAKAALSLKKGSIQALCVLTDALYACGRESEAKKALFIAARRARATDSLFNAAIECAKHGHNELTLILTKRLLKREPSHAQAMRLRACALLNLGMRKQAARVFGRICSLNPEDDAAGVYYRLCSDEGPMPLPLSMAQDIPAQEAVDRSMKLISLLHEEPSEIRSNEDAIREVVVNARWAIYSPMSGANVTLIAIIILSALDTPQTRNVLFDALLDPALDDQIKRSILQAAAAHCSEQPAYADLGGRLVRPAAGAVVPSQTRDDVGQRIVQLAADRLMRQYPYAAQKLLDMWVAYFCRHGAVSRRYEHVCAAALEYAFHAVEGRQVGVHIIAEQYGVSHRAVMVYVRRIQRAFMDERLEEIPNDE